MLEKALAQLRAGRVVAIATESFFGLLADTSSAAALDCLFSLKPRGADKGVPILLPHSGAWLELVRAVPPVAERLAQKFWPGPLSIALDARAEVDARLALGGSIAVRVPGQSPALDLVSAFGRPLTATSANLPGDAPATGDAELSAAFSAALADGRLLLVPGAAPGGEPSTIVVVEDGRLRIARKGAVASSAVLAAVP
jgi:L-threonylcarbamoyladenylate synthase